MQMRSGCSPLWALHLAGVVFRILAAEQPEKAGVGEAQHQKQDDEGEQHPDDDVHLMDRQREFIVELLFRVDEIGVIVVEERFAALRSLCTGCFELGLLLCQRSLTSGESGFQTGQLLLTGGLFFFGHSVSPVFR